MGDLGRIRRLSKNLFGNLYRLEIAAAIHENQSEAVSAIGLHHQTGVFYARVQRELKSLEAAGMLRAVSTDGREVQYKAEPSNYWRLCHEFLAELREE